jgi:tellurite resistance protein
MATGAAVWSLLVIGYIAKWIRRRADAVREAGHPVQCCFVGLLPVSTMLLSLVLLPHSDLVGGGLGVAGGVGNCGLPSIAPDDCGPEGGHQRRQHNYYTCRL